MLSGGSPKIPSIRDCIHNATEYNGHVQDVLKRAKREVTVAKGDVQNSRMEELARVAEKQTFLKIDLEKITKALEKKIDPGTSTQDLCAAIIKVAAYLQDLAKLLFVLQESRKNDFYAEKAVDLVKGHFTQKRTIEQMQEMNEKMIEILHRKSEGSAADDVSGEKTQLDDCAATGDKLATTDSELQDAIDHGVKQDIDATRHVFAWMIQAVQEVNRYMEEHHLSLYPLFENMFIKAMDERDKRGWIDDLRRDLHEIVNMSIRVETVMEKVYTLEDACGDGGQTYQSDESQPMH